MDPSRGELLWAEYVSMVLAGKVHVGPRTLETYEAAARRVASFLDLIPLNRITPEQLDQVVASLSKTYAPETVAKSVRLIRMVLEKAVEHQRLVRSPAANLAAPKVPKREMRILTADEVAQLAGALPDRYRSVPIVAAYMGMRFGEIAGLKVDALDMLRQRLEVKTVLKEPRGQQPFLGPPKSAASARTLIMPKSVVAELASHLEEYPPVGGLVFTTNHGEVLRRGSFGRIWRAAVKDSVGRPCRIHDLRHTQAAWLIEAGEHPKAIQERMGHGSITVTMDRYGHLMQGLDERAAEGLDERFVAPGEGQMRDGAGDVIPLE